MYYYIGAYDMKYDEVKELCHKARIERFNYHCIDKSKNENEGKNRLFNESENTYLESILESEPFKKYMTAIQTSTPIYEYKISIL